MNPVDFTKSLQSLHDDGFCVLPGAVEAGLIDDHLAVFEQAVARHPSLDPGPPTSTSVQREHRQVDGRGVAPRGLVRLRRLRTAFFKGDPSHLRISFSPVLRSFATAWFGGEPVLMHAGTTLHSRGSGLHSDTLNSGMTDPPEHMLRFWCALEDIDPRSGPMALYPGSHHTIVNDLREDVHRRRPDLLAMQARHLEPRTAANAQERFADFGQLFGYAYQLVEERLGNSGINPVTPALKKGDVLAFDPSVFHVSLPCEDPRLTRKSFLCSMYLRDAAWYSPRVYWGAFHDLRSPANQVRFATEETPFGRRVKSYGEDLKEYEERNIVRSATVPA